MEKEKKSFFARWWWVFLVAGVVVGPILGLVVAAVITRVTPKQFESTAIVQVTPSRSAATHVGVLESRQYFATQFEVITAKKTLALVVEELDLVNRWGRNQEESIGVLRESIEVTQRTGTDLIEIKVRRLDPVWAQKIASSVASSYQNRRNAEEVSRANVQLDALNAEIKAQEVRVKEKRKILDKMVRTVGKAYFEGEESESASSVSESNDRSTERELTQYRDVTREYESALALLQELKLKHSTERVALRTPLSTVTIQEDPIESREPVSPNIALNLMIGVVGGGLGGVLLAVLLLLFFGILSMVASKSQTGAEDS